MAKLRRPWLIVLVVFLAIGMLSFVVNRSRNQKIQRRNLAYEGIKVGDSRDAVVAAMGPPHTVKACEYTPFSDPKLEAEFRAKCVQQYEYVFFMRDYTVSFDSAGMVIEKSTAVSP